MFCNTYNVTCTTQIIMICVLVTEALRCPPGTIRRICEETNETYCEYSCTVDNGGCPEDAQCVEVAVPTCNPGQCCSCVNITCLGNCIINNYV